MKSKIILLIAALTTSLIANAQTSPPLLKRTDVKSYEGFIQVLPSQSKTVDLRVDFLKPAYDYKPISSGAMVGLIQLSGQMRGLKLTFDKQCTGDINLKIGIKEFNGSGYGFLHTSWKANTYTNTMSLVRAQFKGKDIQDLESIDSSFMRTPAVKGKEILIDLPLPLDYFPGDVLVLEELTNSITEGRVFKTCSIGIKEK